MSDRTAFFGISLARVKHLLKVDDFEDVDAYLLELAEEAEWTVLDDISRDINDLMERWGTVPPALREAALLLVRQAYEGDPDGYGQGAGQSGRPIGYDALISRYVKLA